MNETNTTNEPTNDQSTRSEASGNAIAPLLFALVPIALALLATLVPD